MPCFSSHGWAHAQSPRKCCDPIGAEKYGPGSVTGLITAAPRKEFPIIGLLVFTLLLFPVFCVAEGPDAVVEPSEFADWAIALPGLRASQARESNPRSTTLSRSGRALVRVRAQMLSTAMRCRLSFSSWINNCERILCSRRGRKKSHISGLNISCRRMVQGVSMQRERIIRIQKCICENFDS